MYKKVAFIGLGNMGGPMAANLAKKGFAVTAFDLSESALEQAKAAGCSVDATIDAAIDGADAVISMLPNGQIVESIFIDNDKVLEKLERGTLIIDCSTVAPSTSRRVSMVAIESGKRFVDAPVSGGVAAATAGTLAFMCGGAAVDVDAASELLSAMGAHVFHAGAAGAGSAAKICNNMLLAIHMTGTAEALALGVKNGLDPRVLSEIMLKSSGANWSLEKYNPFPGVMEGVPASNNYQGGFMTRLMLKDLGLAEEAATSTDAFTPMGRLAHSLYQQYSNDYVDGANLDFSSIQALFLNPQSDDF